MKLQRSIPKIKGAKQCVFNIISELASIVNFLIPSLGFISFCSVPDYTDSAKAVYEYIISKTKKNKNVIVWHVKSKKEVGDVVACNNSNIKIIVVKKNRPLSFLLFCFSKYIIDTHGLYSMVKIKNSQKSIYLTHGMPVKRFGFEYENDILFGVQFADYALATSDYYRGVISHSMGIDEQNVLPVGLPRNDIFFIRDNKESVIRRTLADRYVMYLPTYRVSNDKNKNNGRNLNFGDLIFGGYFEEWKELNECLKDKQFKMVIKPHPLELYNKAEMLSELEQIIVIDDKWIVKNNFSLNLIMKYSSGLITDYSGAFIDYLLTDKPMVFFMPDYNEYKESRGYVFDDFLDTLPGEKVSVFKDVIKILDIDNYKAERFAARRKYNIQSKGNSSAQVCSILFSKESEKKGIISNE